MKRLVLLLTVVGCGGAQSPQAAPAQAEAQASDDDMVADPQTYQMLNDYFGRRVVHVSQCYNDAFARVERKQRPTGYVTVALDVLPSGASENVHVAGSTLGSAEVEQCVAGVVSRWALPKPPHKMAFSYSYNFQPE